MSVPSMVHRSRNTSIVRSAANGDAQDGYSSSSNVDVDEDSAADAEDDNNSKELPACKVKRNYSCSSCDFFTQNPRHFLYHLRDVHREKVRIYECPNCLYASRHFQKLLRHSRMVHGGGGDSAATKTARGAKSGNSAATAATPQHPTSEDEEALSPSPSAGDASMDIDEFDGAALESTVFKCSVCAFTARNQALLGRHEREEHIKTKFFRCTKCTYVTHMKARFTKHVKYHSMPMIKCDMCDFRTPYKWNLDRHCKNHNGKGAFRCSACNFTADIKQSLTVHEMNHHVPPVGQAAGLGVGRRRNKVGASDATAAEEAARIHQSHQVAARNSDAAANDDDDADVDSDGPHPQQVQHKPQPAKKPKITTTILHHSPEQGSFGPDFIHPDDIIQHANGNVYIKNKCKLCSFKSAWDGEMAKHEMKVHNIHRELPPQKAAAAKKPTRPIPNLIPIPSQAAALRRKPDAHAELPSQPPVPAEPVMSQQDINEICAKSANSALKDFASLFGSEDVFSAVAESAKVPDTMHTSTPIKDKLETTASVSVSKGGLSVNSSGGIEVFKQKNASFFDKLKERLMTGTGDACNLICKYCGHESKCLTEQAKHQKMCGKEVNNTHHHPLTFISSSRCQYCRQRCKSSADLYNHLQSCLEALKVAAELKAAAEDAVETDDASDECELKIDEDCEAPKPHPMENRVFVWNNIEVPMDIEIDDPKYDYTDSPSQKVDDNVSLDLSVRTQSPGGGSESSYVQDYVSPTPASRHHSPVNDKIPTHGNDITVAQHKRVFKCPHCTFWASTASRFHVHIVGHLNKKPFECSLCAYRSNWRWDITKHIKLKSVRDPAHESAKVLMTDETGRRNYTKYNKYLTEIHVSSDQTMETSGGSGTRPKHHDRNASPLGLHSTSGKSADLPRLTRAPSNADFSPLLRTPPLRPPPPLKAADGSFFAKMGNEKKNGRQSNSDSKRTLFKCKKCNFRDASREILLAHVKGHYPPQTNGAGVVLGMPVVPSSIVCSPTTPDMSFRGDSPEKDEASVSTLSAKGSQAPFRCGHCNQVSNWKHVIQRHCRLKHCGDIRVVSNKNGQEKIEVEEQMDEPDHIDVPQEGTFKCNACPFSSDIQDEFKTHLVGHTPATDSVLKCHACTYFVSKKEDIFEHLRLHGISDPEDFVNRMLDRNSYDGDLTKKFKCMTCPYVTNSKSQYTYHKQFHKPRGGQYTCSQCSYNVSKRHLLHQHLKVHGINITPQKQNGDVIDLDEISDEIEEVSPSNSTTFESQQFLDIPLVWVSKNGKFSKMFKCRYCPHVNLRKVNIQEHEKMHGVREKNPNSSRVNDIEHHCTECNYVCNNAGVLSSHSKVHQGLYGTVHCLVDSVKTDEEQIRELSKFLNPTLAQIAETMNLEDFENAEDSSGVLDTSGADELMSDESNPSLYFCQECPARFLKDNEYNIHSRLHGVRLFYKCEYCSYSARQKPHLLAHNKVHTDEYQERTRVLQTVYTATNFQPQVYTTGGHGEKVWIVFDNNNKSSASHDLDIEMENYSSTMAATKATKSSTSQNVPLSGTDLFLQKSEAQQKQQQQQLLLKQQPSPPSPKHADPQFGTLMHGNPDFIYPTYLKNGRMKEKRYKCHKCPSAFEKREQYKVHLNLHGSKQRYRCEHCDYSVKYYANYVQHLKKHKMNTEALAARRSSADALDDADGLEDGFDGEDVAENETSALAQQSNNDSDQEKLSVGDQQAFKILQQRLVNNASPISAMMKENHHSADDKRQFLCPCCPYASCRKDAVDNHQKRHISISGVKGNFTCEHCDYSVPQVHFLRDHEKLHFQPNKITGQVEGFMVCDYLKLTSAKVSDSGDSDGKSNDSDSVIFEENQNREFFPPLSDDVSDRFNNNDGEKRYVNVDTGEVAAKNGDTKRASNSNNKMDES